MKAIKISKPGDANVLEIVNIEIPNPKDDEILIQVHAAGVNRPDILQRSGKYPPPPGASELPGLEVSGEVIKLGKECKKFKIHDEVCALVSGGGYAEYVVVAESQCLFKPANLNMIQAASLPETFFTVWINVFERAKLKNSEKILIHGGASGIGVTAIQLSKVFGSEVFVTASTDDKCSKCLNIGADHAINYKKGDFVKYINTKTVKKGVDVILDMVGGDYFQKNLDCLGIDGRMSIIAFLKNSKIKSDIIKILTKRITITGSTLRPRSKEYKAEICKKLEQKVWPFIESEKIRPIIFKVFNFDDVVEAHRLMESNSHFGKIIIKVK